jgi:hypothetical protein
LGERCCADRRGERSKREETNPHHPSRTRFRMGWAGEASVDPR